jgi:hypothetical protein
MHGMPSKLLLPRGDGQDRVPGRHYFADRRKQKKRLRGHLSP